MLVSRPRVAGSILHMSWPPRAPSLLRRTVTSSTSSTTTTTTTTTTTLGVIGGGLAGLSSAVYFVRALSPQARRRTRVVVFERQPRVGGWCHAHRLVDGGTSVVDDRHSLLGRRQSDTLVFETGPRSIRPVGLQGWITIELAHFLGLTPHVLTVDKGHASAKNRYLYDGTTRSLVRLPTSVLAVVRDVLFRRPGGKSSLMRRVLPGILLEPFRKRSKLHTAGHGDESVDAFFARRFGRPLADELVTAMVHGIYAGDTRRLSVRTVFPQMWEAEREWGSVVVAGVVGAWAARRGWKPKSAARVRAERDAREVDAIKARIRVSDDDSGAGAELVAAMERASVWGVEGGVQELAIRMRDWLERHGVEVRTGPDHGTVERLEHDAATNEWRIETPRETVTCSHLITTLPHLLPESFAAPRFAATTVSVVNLAFALAEGERLFPPGFGYLIPRTVDKRDNPHDVLGVLFDSDVMPHVDSSAAQGVYKCSLILGGAHWLDGRVPPRDELAHDRLVARALETLRLHSGRQSDDAAWPGEPVAAFSTTHVECIPQVAPGERQAAFAFRDRLVRRGRGTAAVVGGGFAAVGVNGAVKAASEVGTAFGHQVNDLYHHDDDAKADSTTTETNKGIKRAVRTGMEMWQL
ncbi:hypothetical protein JCM11491_006187 [Sporobolomyces phaffii]